MGEIDEALQRAETEVFTRTPPKTLKAQINFLVRQLKTTRAVAAELGVSQRSVERYRKGDRRHPPRRIQERIDAAVRARWQPRVRKRRRQQAATTTGITIETRARFGYTAPIGSTDDGRMRRLTVHLPPAYARRLFDARAQGAGDRQLREIVAEGLQEMYFKDGGRRAAGLEVAFTDIDYIDVSF
ncbi:MAG TPA: XRE family transcriptional regulator [Streptomyces sp.]|uniref:telomere-protecting terminal protein Tpg n=1 Tax=Streptomyces sp. TaxID=1931 RepID=UPI002D5298C2|nr:XRE family transcriptional regulator [Streptomyces sp.]HZG05680.1 XRE family transcriptional regulator [Streptomyces sp.]